MKTLAIIGAGGHGKVVAETAELMGWKKISFFDDKFPTLSNFSKWEVKGNTEDLIYNISKYYGVHVAIGNNDLRKEKIQLLKKNKANIISIIHPSATISKSAKIGIGNTFFSNIIINADSMIQDGVILNTSTSVDHDCVIESYSHLSPNVTIGGNVKIGKQCWLGIGVSVINSIKIGKKSIIGAGGVVINDIPSYTLSVGIPAKIKKNIK